MKEEYKKGPDLFSYITLFACMFTFAACTINANANDNDQLERIQQTEIEPITEIDIGKIVYVFVEEKLPKPPALPEWKKNQRFKSYAKARKCIVENVFFEARGTDREEMQRVVNVTMNRVYNEGYRDTVCGVVWQDHQFSWTLDKNLRIEYYFRDLDKAEHQAVQIALELADKALKGELEDITYGALYYHTHAVNPKWNRNKEIKVASNWHLFY